MYKGDDGEAHGDAGNLVCARCGGLLIAPIGSDAPNYCWYCNIEYEKPVKIRWYKDEEKNKVGEI